MKILVVGFAKIKYMPYANFYLDNIDRKEHELHFVYWNRDLQDEDVSKYTGIKLHEFRCFQEDNVARGLKVKSFLMFRKYVKQVLREAEFDFVIVLHTMAGVLLRNIWTKKYQNRYIFDYRDSTYERFSFFKRMIAGLIENSRATFTSSDGFRVYFPQSSAHKVHTTHNILVDSLDHRSLERKPSDKIRVSFWGFVRDEATNREIIAKFSADPRFELHYYGREQAIVKRLKEYARNICAENVFFHGEYVPHQRYEFAANTELLHNLYRGPNMMLAMGNKYYDGSLFYIPQLCMQGSFMGRMAEDREIGCACDPWANDFMQVIYEYYTKLDRQAFHAACDREVARIIDEYHGAVEVLCDCLQESAHEGAL